MIEMPRSGFRRARASLGIPVGCQPTASPDPGAIFRFAEPVHIDSQQNFRVEMQFPRDVPEHLANVHGPLRVWVMLDGYLVRDVQ